MANEKKKVGRPKWTDEQRKAAAEAQADRKKKEHTSFIFALKETQNNDSL